MRAAAQFHGVAIECAVLAADLYYADAVSVFVAKKLHNVSTVNHLGMRNFNPGDGFPFFHAGIYFFFQSADLLCAEGLGIKVKSKAFRRDAGTLLGGVSGDDLVECPVQQVGRRMVRFDRGSALPVERDVQRAAHLEA